MSWLVTKAYNYHHQHSDRSAWSEHDTETPCFFHWAQMPWEGQGGHGQVQSHAREELQCQFHHQQELPQWPVKTAPHNVQALC